MLGLDDGTRHSALCNPLLADLEAGTAPDECGAKADIVHLVLDVLGETYQVDINKNDLLSAIKCSSVPTDATNVLERWFNSWCGSLESLSARNKQDTQYFHMAFLIFFVVNGLCYPIRKPGLSCNFDSISSGLSMVVLVGALIRHIDSSRRYHSYEDILGEQAKFLTISTNVSKFNSYYFYSTYWWIDHRRDRTCPYLCTGIALP